MNTWMAFIRRLVWKLQNFFNDVRGKDDTEDLSVGKRRDIDEGRSEDSVTSSQMSSPLTPDDLNKVEDQVPGLTHKAIGDKSIHGITNTSETETPEPVADTATSQEEAEVGLDEIESVPEPQLDSGADENDTPEPVTDPATSQTDEAQVDLDEIESVPEPQLDFGADENDTPEPVTDPATSQTRPRNPRVTFKDGLPTDRHEEDIHEYSFDESGLEVISDSYRAWNAQISKRLLLVGMSTETAFLSVTPSVLSSLSAEISSGLEAEAYFCTTVEELYKHRVLRHSGRMRILRRIGDDGFPECLGFLGLSVLAAFHMHSDEEGAGNAYYIRLAQLLNCPRTGIYPTGFDTHVFESLWKFVAHWLLQTRQQKLAMPEEEIGNRRFVAIPLAHVPLRIIDIEKLPAFFDWAGYQPGSQVTIETLDRDLNLWNAVSAFTTAGASALVDERRTAVLAQIRSELDCWDGEVSDIVLRRRSAVVELLLDIRRRKSNLYFLPRCPIGFPETFDNGIQVFHSSDVGWYDPVTVREGDGELLAEGFEWETVHDGFRILLRQSAKKVIPLTPSDAYSGFVSNRSLLAGVNCAVLCRDDDSRTVSDYLGYISENEVAGIKHPNLPHGWSLYSSIIPKRHQEPPEGLDAIKVDMGIDLVMTGGLKVGRRQQWITAAPPKVIVSGIFGEDVVMIDGDAVPVSDGVVEATEKLRVPGIHVFSVGNAEKRVESVEPTIGRVAEYWKVIPEDNFAVGLKQGSWIVIGKKPTESMSLKNDDSQSVFAKIPFEPMWAIEVGGGPGARVSCLSATLKDPCKVSKTIQSSRQIAIDRWISTIYNAHVRHPQVSGHKPLSASQIISSWKKYVKVAKNLKRSRRRGTK